MNSFKSLIVNPHKTRYYGEDEDEVILYVLRASLLTLIPRFLPVILLAAFPFFADGFLVSLREAGLKIENYAFLTIFWMFWYLFVAGVLFQTVINWFFNVYIITNKKILDFDFRGVLYKNISETTLDNVEDVTSTVRGALGVVFNIGTIKIQTAGELPEFEFENIDEPSKIRDAIADLVVKYRHKHGRRENA